MDIITQDRISEVAYELLVKTTTCYPVNFLDKLFNGLTRETNQSSKGVLASIIQNIASSALTGASMCQDTGVPTFHVWLNPGLEIKGDLKAGFEKATNWPRKRSPSAETWWSRFFSTIQAPTRGGALPLFTGILFPNPAP